MFHNFYMNFFIHISNYFSVQRSLDKERRRQNHASKYKMDGYRQRKSSDSGIIVSNQAQETVLEEDKPTAIDVAIAATRDLHMQQAKGYGAFALRSQMLIRYSQKVN